jgi:hypothetical protein
MSQLLRHVKELRNCSELRIAKLNSFDKKFLPSLVEGSRAAWCGGASGDEGRNYIIRGESTVGYIGSCSAV